MALTRGQKAVLHTVPKALGIDDDVRRTIQRSIGRFESAADPRASRLGFIAVMAFYEGRAPGNVLPGNTAGYWAAQLRAADPRDAQRELCRRAAGRLGWSEEHLARWIASEHLTSGQYRALLDLPPYWLGRCLDGLRAMLRRKGVA